MRKPDNNFWGIVALAAFLLIGILTGSAVWFKHQLTSAQLESILRLLIQFIGPAAVVALLILLICFGMLAAIFRRYILPARKIADEVSLINSANPSHRIAREGAAEFCRLCDLINEAAERYETLAQNVDERIQRASAESEWEKDTLAAIMAELPEGVLICNTEGRILLYNNRARQLLSGLPGGADNNQKDAASPGERSRYIGLGRSVYGVIDRNLIGHALDQISAKLRSGDPRVVCYFRCVGCG